MWGHRVATLEKYAEQHGKIPQALLDKPYLPWYYQHYLTHFFVLSSRRKVTYLRVEEAQGKKTIQKILALPSTIDIPTILKYNEEIVKEGPDKFLAIVATLDDLYLADYKSKNNG